MNPNINKLPIVGLHFIQPNLRVVAIEDDAVLGGSMGVLYSAHNVVGASARRLVIG